MPDDKTPTGGDGPTEHVTAPTNDGTQPGDTVANTPATPAGGLVGSHVEHTGPRTGDRAEPSKGKHVVYTHGGDVLNVGKHRVTAAGLEVGPQQLKDIQQAADEAGLPIHVVHGQEA